MTALKPDDRKLIRKPSRQVPVTALSSGSGCLTAVCRSGSTEVENNPPFFQQILSGKETGKNCLPPLTVAELYSCAFVVLERELHCHWQGGEEGSTMTGICPEDLIHL